MNQSPPLLRPVHGLVVLAGGAAAGYFVSELASIPEMGRIILTRSTQAALPNIGIGACAATGAAGALALWLAWSAWLSKRHGVGYADALARDAVSFAPLLLLCLLAVVYLAPSLKYYPFFLIPLALAGFVGIKRCAMPADDAKLQRAGLWLGACIAVFAATFTTLNVLQIRSVNVPFTDSGYFERMMWNMCHGNVLHACEHEHIFLGTRVRFVQFALWPVYALCQTLYTLSFVQTLAVALGAAPVYLLARRVLDDNRLALACGAAYLLYPGTQYLVSDASGEIVRLGTLGMPATLLALYWLESRRPGRAALAFAFALTCREEYALLLAMAGVYQLVRAGMSRRERWFGAAFTLAGAAWFVLALFVVVPHFQGQAFRGLQYYGDLGESGGGILRTLLTRPGVVLCAMFTPAKVGFLLHLVVPLCLLPLLSWRVLLAAPAAAICLLSSKGQVASILFHYHAAVMPFVFFALPFGVRAAANRGASCRRGIVWAMVTASLACSVLAGKSPLSLTFYDTHSPYHFGKLYAPDARSAEAWRVRDAVPRTASVCATEFIATLFTHHAKCWTFPDQLDRADFVVADRNDRWFRKRPDAVARLEALCASPQWRVASDAQGIVVLERSVMRDP